MVKLEALRPAFADVSDLLVQADGYALWIVWQGSINPVVLQTLEDYGGIRAAEADGQELWFFFSTDVLLAAARLGVWARFNPLPLGLLVFPARFLSGEDGGRNLIISEGLWHQTFSAPDEFRILVHNAMKEASESTPGIKVLPPEPGSKEDAELWSLLEVDPRLPYQSPLSWYAVLRPLGNAQDKSFHQGWREYLSQLEALLQRNKLRFSVHDSNLMFPLDSLRQVRTWCRDMLSLIVRLKSENQEAYWPCAMAIVDRKGLTLNEDLPGRIGVAWEHMVPDYPHMSMRNALMLGPEFAVHAVRFAAVRHHPDDWANVSLSSSQLGGSGSIPQLAPVSLILGPHEHCFYCGQRSHEPAQCPSRVFNPQDAGIWRRVARLDFTSMRAAVAEIDSRLVGCADAEARQTAVTTLLREDTAASVMLRAFFDLNWPCQLRAVNFFWRARSKDFQSIAKNLVPLDNSPVWSFLEEMPAKEPAEAEKEIKQLAVKYSKDFRVHTIRGFLALERGDAAKAEKFWKDAEIYSPHPIVQAWHVFLQARSLECRGLFSQAAQLYEQVSRSCPSWLDAEYRRAVCLVKTGFSEQGIAAVSALIERSGHFFNKALIDPELERGCIQMLATLYSLWSGMESKAKEEAANLKRIRAELATWFLEENEFAESIAGRVDKILQLSSVNNFVAFQMLVSGRLQIERELQAHVLQEAREYKTRFRAYGNRLKVIHDESAWFPFPSTLVEFNKSYNEGVANMNWALKANLHTPEAFRKAQTLDKHEEERLKKLESRLKFLRIIRDSTLFLLSMTETFLWLEVVGIIAIFVILPLILLYGDKIGLDMLVGTVARERWQVQKALFIMVSLFAVGIAGLRTLLRFEAIRDKILTKAKSGMKPSARGKKK